MSSCEDFKSNSEILILDDHLTIVPQLHKADWCRYENITGITNITHIAAPVQCSCVLAASSFATWMNLTLSLDAGVMFPQNEVAYLRQSWVLGKLRSDICSALDSFHNWAIQVRGWKDFLQWHTDAQDTQSLWQPENQGVWFCPAVWIKGVLSSLQCTLVSFPWQEGL